MKALASIALALHIGSGVFAQTTSSEIPPEIRRLLLRSPFSGAEGGAYRLGLTMPDGFPAELIPPGATVVASAASPVAMAVVVRLADGPVKVYPLFWKAQSGGWISNVPQRTGFTDESSSTPLLSLSLCRGQSFASFIAEVPTPKVRFVRIAIAPEPSRSCARHGSDWFSDVPVPLLALPPGVRLQGGSGGGGSENAYSTGTRLDNVTSVSAVVTHLVAQMQDAGWILEGTPLSDDSQSISRLSATTRNGDPVTAILTLVALPPTTSYDAVLRIVRNKPIIRRQRLLR